MQKVCIIVPCFNEEKRISIEYFKRFYQFPESACIDISFVNDGSMDKTLYVLRQLRDDCKGHVIVYDIPENLGKAEAIRKTVLKISTNEHYDFIGYFDADLSTPLEEVFLLQECFNRNKDCQVAFGSRVKRMGASIIRKPFRHYLGRIFATFASLLLNLPVYDTQCGAKLFTRELAYRTFTEEFISRWLFDIEIFARIKELYGVEKAKKIMFEVPLNNWKDRSDSKITFKDILNVPFEFLKIRKRYKT
ncbi:MAG: glycosyltransferase [Desulfobacterales bacterium]|nr:glycosyltransferase [Desulfobacterales bacterium]